jgi:hypothetical protein
MCMYYYPKCSCSILERHERTVAQLKVSMRCMITFCQLANAVLATLK